ncbi:MAG: DUF4912 domain-containing protein [Firmicutes bacterium]|nr:DUF4912 domain-containing protein [Bacillota bacterium]
MPETDPIDPEMGKGDSHGELPHRYEEDRLILLPRDPYCLFAYWEISTATGESIRKRWAGETGEMGQPNLRVFRHRWNHAGTIESHDDHRLEEKTDNWYIHVGAADNFYHVEWGWILPGGDFYSLLESNVVRTPRDGISEIIDEKWKLPDWKSRKLFRRISLYHLSSAELVGRKIKIKK